VPRVVKQRKARRFRLRELWERGQANIGCSRPPWEKRKEKGRGGGRLGGQCADR